MDSILFTSMALVVSFSIITLILIVDAAIRVRDNWTDDDDESED